MRIRYTGADERSRVAEISRIKFMPDGFRATDKQSEWDDRVKGPAIVAHVVRHKGGKRLIIEVPQDFDMAEAEFHLLEHGWVDLVRCYVKFETLY